MPCQDHEPVARRLQARADKLARMLCFAMRKIANSNNFPVNFTLSDEDTKIEKELIQWWKDHELFDKKRKKKTKG